MRRKASKKTRAPNAQEKQFMGIVKHLPCIECGDYPVIVDHMYGSSFKNNKALIGMWALLPLCENCDRVKTLGSHRAYLVFFGHTQAQAFKKLLTKINVKYHPPEDVINAIMDWNR